MLFIFGLYVSSLIVTLFGSYVGDAEVTKIGSAILLFSSGGLLGNIASRK